MSSDLIKFNLKSVEATLKSPFSMFALTNSTDDPKALSHSIEFLAKTITFLHDVFIETQFDVEKTDMVVRVDAANKREYESHYFKPQVLTGVSPFVPYKNKDNAVGVLVRLQNKQVQFCGKSLNKIARERFESALRNDEPITMKEAKRSVEVELKNNPHRFDGEVPLVEKFQDHYFYIDFKTQVILAKNAHRCRDAINMFFALLMKAGKSLQNSHPELHEKLDKLMTETFKERPEVLNYSTFALTHKKAFGAYNIHDVVAYYSKEEKSKEAAPLPMSPTDTAGFISEKETEARIEFKNAMGYFLNHEKKALPSYQILSSFSEKHHLKAYSLRVMGEIPKTEQLARYLEAHPEGASDEITSSTLTLGFETKASDGNISFKIFSGLSWVVDAAKRLLNDKFNDTHIARKQLEPFFLEEMGGMLEVLHHSCALFIDFYIRANQAGEHMETVVDKDIKRNQDRDAPIEQPVELVE